MLLEMFINLNIIGFIYCIIGLIGHGIITMEIPDKSNRIRS